MSDETYEASLDWSGTKGELSLSDVATALHNVASGSIDYEDPRDDNLTRAYWCAEPLRVFGEEVFDGNADGESADTLVSDFLCDLMHFCDAAGFEFSWVLETAQINYGAELTDDGYDMLTPVLKGMKSIVDELDDDADT